MKTSPNYFNMSRPSDERFAARRLTHLAAPRRRAWRRFLRRGPISFGNCGPEYRRPIPNKALWEKGDFTRIAENMRESGEALVDSLGITPGLEVLDLGCGDGTTALPAARIGADVLGVDIASNLVDAGNPRAEAAGLDNLRFQEGDATDLDGLADEQLRPRRQHLRRDVRAQAVRRRQGDGARDQARRADRHGQLDPGRSDARRADPEDQLRLLAAAARGLRQPDDLGRRGARRASGSPPPASRRTSISFERDTFTFRLRRLADRARRRCSATTTGRR